METRVLGGNSKTGKEKAHEREVANTGLGITHGRQRSCSCFQALSFLVFTSVLHICPACSEPASVHLSCLEQRWQEHVSPGAGHVETQSWRDLPELLREQHLKSHSLLSSATQKQHFKDGANPVGRKQIYVPLRWALRSSGAFCGCA